MDPISLSLGGVAAAVIGKATEAAGSRLGEGASSAVGRLVDWLRARFRDREDDAGAGALAKVENVGDSPRLLSELAAAIDRHAADPAFRGGLQRLIDEIDAAGRRAGAGPITQMVAGDGNVVAAQLTDSEIHVTRADPPPGARGSA
jgi:hypothetical protein